MRYFAKRVPRTVAHNHFTKYLIARLSLCSLVRIDADMREKKILNRA